MVRASALAYGIEADLYDAQKWISTAYRAVTAVVVALGEMGHGTPGIGASLGRDHSSIHHMRLKAERAHWLDDALFRRAVVAAREVLTGAEFDAAAAQRQIEDVRKFAESVRTVATMLTAQSDALVLQAEALGRALAMHQAHLVKEVPVPTRLRAVR
jgi:hypothetical protein